MTTTRESAYLTGDYTCSVCQTTRFVGAGVPLPECCGLGILLYWDHQNTLGAPLHRVEVRFDGADDGVWSMPMTEQPTTREFYNVWHVLPDGMPGPHRGLYQVTSCMYMGGLHSLTLDRQGAINPRLRLHAIARLVE